MINMFKDTVLVSAAFCGFVLLCAAIESFPIPTTLLAVFGAIAFLKKSYW